MVLHVLEQEFSICKIKEMGKIDWEDEICFVAKTDEECSLVCSTNCVPKETEKRDDGWRAFRIAGILDFSLVGILSEISGILAENKIGIFAVSTYNTDYILIKKENFERAVLVLDEAGYAGKEKK